MTGVQDSQQRSAARWVGEAGVEREAEDGAHEVKHDQGPSRGNERQSPKPRRARGSASHSQRA